MGTPRQRALFLGLISLMTFTGANNDFLGKVVYQSLPGAFTGYAGLRNRYWIAWLLTFGTFAVCANAMWFGWRGGREWRAISQRKQWHIFLSNACIAVKAAVMCGSMSVAMSVSCSFPRPW